MMGKQYKLENITQILTKAQRGNVNIKGLETGIKGTGERILQRPYSP